MNIEMNDNLIGKIGFRFQEYTSRAIASVREAVRRLSEKRVRPERRVNGKGAGQPVIADRERYHTEAAAQLQPVRYFR